MWMWASLVVQWLRIHLAWSRKIPLLLSPCAATTEAHTPGACAPQQKKPLQWEAHTLQQRVASAYFNYRKPARPTKTYHNQKINKNINLKKKSQHIPKADIRMVKKKKKKKRMVKKHTIKRCWEFPGGPVAKTLHSWYRGAGFDPWSGN